uniref:AlNc14C514G12018 protein n=1 Tax=Albugo laibachii Nc14 TaxID=890382 RepID=F0X0S4_9STRA|nr:AlNc14C514G12018 [Albugo laibachii Nc14]|eukprot:CCA27368.1 AlNc14C514G12018 [Albugo laibachii Nc14]
MLCTQLSSEAVESDQLHFLFVNAFHSYVWGYSRLAITFSLPRWANIACAIVPSIKRSGRTIAILCLTFGVAYIRLYVSNILMSCAYNARAIPSSVFQSTVPSAPPGPAHVVIASALKISSIEYELRKVFVLAYEYFVLLKKYNERVAAASWWFIVTDQLFELEY